MKKLLKGVIFVVLMLVMGVALTGCGEEEEEVPEVVNFTLIAEKTSTKNEETMQEKHEFIFIDNKFNSVKMTYHFSDEAAATMMGGYMKLSFDNTIIEGTKVTINLSAAEYQSEVSNSQQKTKDEMKASLESDGYTVTII